MEGDRIITRAIRIAAPPARVWEALTDTKQVEQWMVDTPMDVLTDWTVGGPIVLRVHMHGITYENKGTVLEVVPEQSLSYNFWSRISRLPDRPENYATLAFRLEPGDDGTQLTVTLTYTKSASRETYMHGDFYWAPTLAVLKAFIEKEKR